MWRRAAISIICIVACWTARAAAADQQHDEALERVFHFTPCAQDGEMNTCVRYSIRVHRRNAVLSLVPSMLRVARGKRQYDGETLARITLKNGKVDNVEQTAAQGSMARSRETMSIMKQFTLPQLYHETIFGDFLLSPFNSYNRRLYRYEMTPLSRGRLEIVFRPKVRNAQLISGRAIVADSTGQIVSAAFRGVLDMVTFRVRIKMSGDGSMPETSQVNARFRFLGNKITAQYYTYYNIGAPLHLPPVGGEELTVVGVPEGHTVDSLSDGQAVDSTQTDVEKEDGRKLHWTDLAEHLIERIKGKFGNQQQGSYRVSPLLNPMYLSYSGSKGITYKMKLTGTYNTSENSRVALTVNLGYAFKQKRLYANIPLRYTFNRRTNLYTELEVGIGNRITDSQIEKQIKHERADSIDWDAMHLDYFKDLYWRLRVNIPLTRKLSVKPGVVFHRRTAVDRQAFTLADRPLHYYSFAPTLQLTYRPMGDTGPVITTDYEHGIKGPFNATMEYERIEADISWKHALHSMRSLSGRVGGGFYTSRSKGSYFLDYTNFRYDNIPGGWNDDWTGEFQLLHSNWYNSSKYYVRGNATYESPMLLAARLPWAGRFIETERLYANVLFVELLHPYVEYGYGFTNRLFSMGVFCATHRTHFRSLGCRFAIELFRDW